MKNTTKTTKRQLETSINFQGGQLLMKRSKCILEKDKLESKRKENAKNFPGINLDDELESEPCKHYERYNAHVRSGVEWKESDDPALLRLANSTTQPLDAGESV